MKKTKKLPPIALLSTGYFVIIIFSACILSLPVSSSDGSFSPYIDSLFTAASAITTTGLIVVDTGSYYNHFGQIIILLLFQAGGLGYMLFVVLIFVAFQKKISIQSNLMLQESVRRPLKMDVFRFLKTIILFTLIIESAGAVLLAFIFNQKFSAGHSLYSGIFHSISAFNTAGFSIYQDSLCGFQNNLPANTVLIIVSTLGSLGFFVLYDMWRTFLGKANGAKNRRLSVHSRLVLISAVIILCVGSLLIFFTENWGGGAAFKQKVLASLFQISSASTTTGFNSIDIGGMRDSGLFIMIILMFIGAGSGGTAGGIKITTFIVIVLSTYAIIRNRSAVNVFKRRLPFEVIRNSFAITMLSLFWIIAAVSVLSITENIELFKLLFETASAMGTVGLSMGITADLSITGKLIIILSMFIGRLGPLGVGISLFRETKEPDYKYSTTDIFIG